MNSLPIIHSQWVLCSEEKLRGVKHLPPQLLKELDIEEMKQVGMFWSVVLESERSRTDENSESLDHRDPSFRKSEDYILFLLLWAPYHTTQRYRVLTGQLG